MPRSGKDARPCAEQRGGKKAMTKPHMDRWARVRVRGKKRYFWLSGVIGWGISMGILVGAINRLGGTSWVQSASSLVLLPIGGYFWDFFMWHWMERRFRNVSGTY